MNLINDIQSTTRDQAVPAALDLRQPAAKDEPATSPYVLNLKGRAAARDDEYQEFYEMMPGAQPVAYSDPGQPYTSAARKVLSGITAALQLLASFALIVAAITGLVYGLAILASALASLQAS